jgi:nicotinate-nucleotide adenylyltransferase
MAEQCREQARLERVLFVPAARPPHKLDRELTAFHYRADMVELAISGHPAMEVCPIENDRPGPSYTVDTLRQLQADMPGNEWFLILGSDSVRDLPGWHQPAQIAALASLLVVQRPGAALPGELAAFRWQVVQSPLIGVSSSDLRQRVGDGRSLRYLVPRAVECYIETHALYRTPGRES